MTENNSWKWMTVKEHNKLFFDKPIMQFMKHNKPRQHGYVVYKGTSYKFFLHFYDVNAFLWGL